MPRPAAAGGGSGDGGGGSGEEAGGGEGCCRFEGALRSALREAYEAVLAAHLQASSGRQSGAESLHAGGGIVPPWQPQQPPAAPPAEKSVGSQDEPADCCAKTVATLPLCLNDDVGSQTQNEATEPGPSDPIDGSTAPDPQEDAGTGSVAAVSFSEKPNRPSNFSGECGTLGSFTLAKSQKRRNYDVRTHWAGGLHGRRTFDADRVSTRATFVAKLNRLPATTWQEDEEVRIIRFVLVPNSPSRLLWDLAGAVLLLHDMIFFPLGALGPMDHTYFYIVDVFMMFFWTMDMLLSFRTAYYSRGQLILNQKRIAKNYIMTWFPLDLIIIVPDWLYMLMSSEDGGGSQLRALRIMRIARVARLARLMKLKRLLVTMGDMVNSEYVAVMLTVLKLFILMLFVTHFVGCLWYLVGDYSVDKGNTSNWIQVHNFYEKGFLYRYFTTLHWSITQFTPGSMHVQPQNLGERAFAVVVLLFGMIIFSSFVSSITSAMTSLRQQNAGLDKQLWLLRRYLRENSVDRALSFRVLRFVEHQHNEPEDRLPESSVSLLHTLSDQLLSEIKVATTMRPLTVHPIFAQIHGGAPITVQQIVRQAVSVKHLALGDTVFSNRQNATQMYVAVLGQLEYAHRLQQTFAVQKGIWVGEAVLWTCWQHTGVLQTATECRLLCIEHEAFGQVIGSHSRALDLARGHAKEFIEWLNFTDNEEHTDLPCDEDYRATMMNFTKTQVQRSCLNWQVDQIQAVSC